MHSAERTVMERLRGEQMRELGMALHDLCQPLTTLQCRLEMAEMIDTEEAYREAVDAGSGECMRLAEKVEGMREILRAMMRDEAERDERE